jgi:hypothetical protein
VIGSFSPLRREKNIERLIRVFAQLSSRSAPVRLVICGDGPERAQLSDLANHLNLTDRVTFTGHVSRPELVMGAFDVFAITSGTEKCRKRSSKRVGAAAGRRDRCRRHTDYGGRRESPFHCRTRCSGEPCCCACAALPRRESATQRRHVDRHGIRALTHFRCRCARFGRHCTGGCLPWYCFRSVSPAGLLINDVEIGPDRILITARCRAAAGTCPDCGRPSGIICDLERRRIVDLLPDREPATVEAWLSHHPEVRVIARDRGAGYGQAATRAAPQAVQVTDR